MLYVNISVHRRIGNETERRVRAEFDERGRREDAIVRQENIITQKKQI
jgi:hypothetical protein